MELGKLKYPLIAALAIGICLEAFVLANHNTLALAAKQEQPVQTEYPAALAAMQAAKPTAEQMDFVYTIAVHGNNTSLPAGSVTAEQAAEAAARALSSLFNYHLNGETVGMISGIDMLGKPFWQGTIKDEKDPEAPPHIVFHIDGISGEVSSLDRTFDAKLLAGENTAGEFYNQEANTAYWQEHCAEHVAVAKEIAAQFMGSEIVAAEMYGVGCIGGYTPPEKGKKASFTTSTVSAEQVDNLADQTPIPPDAFFLTIAVTDEYGRQCHVTMTTEQMTLLFLYKIVPQTADVPGLG